MQITLLGEVALVLGGEAVVFPPRRNDTCSACSPMWRTSQSGRPGVQRHGRRAVRRFAMAMAAHTLPGLSTPWADRRRHAMNAEHLTVCRERIGNEIRLHAVVRSSSRARSSVTTARCSSPTAPAPPAGRHIERIIGSADTPFAQYPAGYVDCGVEHRSHRVVDGPLWTIWRFGICSTNGSRRSGGTGHMTGAARPAGAWQDVHI